LNWINHPNEYQMIYLSETSGRALPDVLKSKDSTLMLHSIDVDDDLKTKELKYNFKEVEKDIRTMVDTNK
jgi:hypothetical protein